jgi:hypothetical protein
MELREQELIETAATPFERLNVGVHNELVAFGRRLDNSFAFIRLRASPRTRRSIDEGCQDRAEAALGIAAKLIRSLWHDFEADIIQTLHGDERPAKLDKLLLELEYISVQLEPPHRALY